MRNSWATRGGGSCSISGVTPKAERCAISAKSFLSRYDDASKDTDHFGRACEHVGIEAIGDASSPARVRKGPEHVAEHRAVEQTLGCVVAKRPKVGDGTHRRMRCAGLAIGRAGERHAHPSVAEVRENAAMEDLVVRVGQDDQV